MTQAWLNFAILICIQLILFIALAVYRKQLASAPKLLARSLFIGLVMGSGFDLILGKLMGFSTYVLGFGALFLILNAILSYGIFSATILLLREIRLGYFFVWSTLIMAVYEIANHFFHVWTWNFPVPFVQYVLVLTVGYFGGSLLVVVIERLLYTQKP